MIIRKASEADAMAITSYILLAMGDIIYHLIGENDADEARACMYHLVSSSDNQYAYENCWVAEEDHHIIAAACVYDGAKITELRTPVLEYLKKTYHHVPVLGEETQKGEFYLDCLGVDLTLQGKGIGSKMLQFLIDEYVVRQKQTLGLLVDKENPNAKRLYLKSGFEVVGHKNFAGKKMEHLQIAGKALS